jgi:hypothetical protein
VVWRACFVYVLVVNGGDHILDGLALLQQSTS